MRRLGMTLLGLCWLPFILAAQVPAMEERLHHLSLEIRCLVCQNQSLAESDAPLAQDLRREIQIWMEEGLTDAEIKKELVARFGEFVLLAPPMQKETYLLWFLPIFLVLAAAGVGLWVVKKYRRGS